MKYGFFGSIIMLGSSEQASQRRRGKTLGTRSTTDVCLPYRWAI